MTYPVPVLLYEWIFVTDRNTGKIKKLILLCSSKENLAKSAEQGLLGPDHMYFKCKDGYYSA